MRIVQSLRKPDRNLVSAVEAAKANVVEVLIATVGVTPFVKNKETVAVTKKKLAKKEIL